MKVQSKNTAGNKQNSLSRGQYRDLHVHVKPCSASLRVETIKEEEYIVVPAVILVEGVIQGALASNPELALSSEFGKNPAAWNGRPVVVNHPQRNGQFVSAGSADVFEQERIGWIFNTYVQDGKLKTEIWANKEWLTSDNEDHQMIRDNLENSQVMEVSTGLFMDLEEVTGVWNGERYQGVWRNCVPDHLAILTDSPGACSVADGCGTSRTNTQPVIEEVQSMKDKMLDQQPKSDRIVSLIAKLLTNVSGMSTSDQAAAANAALQTVEEYFYLLAVYDDSVVYDCYDTSTGNWLTKRRMCTFNSDGSVTISSNAEEVLPVTNFVPVSITVNEVPEVSGTETPGEPAVNEAPTTETPEAETPEAPAALEADPPVEVTEVVSEVGAAEITGSEVDTGSTITLPEVAEPMTLQAFRMKGASEDVQKVNEAIMVLEEVRAGTCAIILANPMNRFTSEELKSFSLQQLRKIASVAEKTDYTALGSPQVHMREADPGYTAPMVAFPRK